LWGAIDLQSYGFSVDLLRDSLTLMLADDASMKTEVVILPQLAYSRLPGNLSTRLIEQWNAFAQESGPSDVLAKRFVAEMSQKNKKEGLKRDTERMKYFFFFF
jgi:hypothetical protein